jgi:glycine cleavage system H protein
VNVSIESVRGCHFPKTLYYHVEHNVWLRLEQDHTVTLGMTSYACSLAGDIVALTPVKISAKRFGKVVKIDRSCATVESGKWVGPVKVPVVGEVLEFNDAVLADPRVINTEPYAAGWIAKLQPEDWDRDLYNLTTGDEAFEAFENKMAADGFGGC